MPCSGAHTCLRPNKWVPLSWEIPKEQRTFCAISTRAKENYKKRKLIIHKKTLWSSVKSLSVVFGLSALGFQRVILETWNLNCLANNSNFVNQKLAGKSKWNTKTTNIFLPNQRENMKMKEKKSRLKRFLSDTPLTRSRDIKLGRGY